MTQESPIFDLSHRLPENPDIFYLNAVRIPPSPKRKINKKIYVCNYDKNDEADKEKCKVDYGGYFGSFFGAITGPYGAHIHGGKSTLINVMDLSVIDILTKSGTMSSVGV